MKQPLKVVMAAGELSGDKLGAGLLQALKAQGVELRCAGIAGPRMKAAGCEPWFDVSELSVMGLAEVLAELPRIARLRRRLVRRALSWGADLFVGIDSPDFNLGAARRLRRRGVATVQYVSPTIWAWRPGRVRSVRAAVDQVLCVLPFEPPLYASEGVPARFVGHPLADELSPAVDRRAAREALSLPPDAPVVALLPGSRRGELMRLGPLFADTARLISAKLPGAAFVAPMANRETATLFDAELRRSGMRERVVECVDDTVGALSACSVALVASGTATLETALLGRAMVVGYRVAPLTALLLRRLNLLKVSRIALPNLLAGRALVPEFLQGEAQAPALADAVCALLEDEARRSSMEEEFAKIHARLRRGASRGAAEALVELMARRGRM